MIQNYRDLTVWQKAMDLAEMAYHTTQTFPKEQSYVLTSQIQRCAFSVASNIAEGRSRHSEADFIYHLNIARGSLSELETQIIIAYRIGLIPKTKKEEVLNLATEITKMLFGLRSSLQEGKAKTCNLKPVT